MSRGAFSGGLIGTSRAEDPGSDASIIDCYSSGPITTPADFNGGLVGGLAGIHSGSLGARVDIIRSYSSGTVTVTTGVDRQFLGSLVGHYSVSTGAHGAIQDSYSQSNVVIQSPNANSAGALFGRINVSDATITITNVYASGSVSGPDLGPRVGALVGNLTSDITPLAVTDSFWNSDLMPDGVGAGGVVAGAIGVSEASLKMQATFTNWDFSTIWMIDETNGFPIHR